MKSGEKFQVTYLIDCTFLGTALLLLRLRKAGRVWCGGARETH